MGRSRAAPWLVAALVVGMSAAGAGGSAQTSITIWANTPPGAAYGGLTYGGSAPPSGALISERRDVDITSGGEVRITGIAATVDPGSVQLRSLTDPAGVTVSQQRFVPGATTPDEILARHVGDTITVVTPKGELTGILQSSDAQAIVVEIGAGDQRHLQVLRRDGYVQDIRLPPGTTVDKPSLAWRLAARKPGKHTVEVTYRAEGMSWSADYLAVFDPVAKTIDFSAWATVKNATGASFDGAELVLINGGGNSGAAQINPYVVTPPRRSNAPARFVVPTLVRIGNGEAVQVELMRPLTSAKTRSVVTFEAMADTSANFQAYPATDCNQLNAGPSGTGRAEVALELDVPTTLLPDGRVRMFERRGERLEVVSEDQLRSSAGIARVRLSPDNDISGERHTVSCTTDERARTIHEKLEVKLANKGKQPVEVVVREFAWRWPMWRIDPTDETAKGSRAGPQTQEYRLAVPAGGKKSVTYTVIYTW